VRALRHDLIDWAISEHGGKIAQTGGDSLLIVFDSIDGAVRCAIRVQQQVPVIDGGISHRIELSAFALVSTLVMPLLTGLICMGTR
jgi:hypothetical protein